MRFMILTALLAAQPAFAGQKIVVFRDGSAPEARARLAAGNGGRIIKTFPFIGAALVDFPDETRAARLFRSPDVESVEDDFEINWLAAETPFTLEAAQAAAAALLSGEDTAFAPPAVSTPPAPAAPPFITTANAEGKLDRLPWSSGRLLVPKAWARTRGAGARVAVLDTGVDCSHPDLAANCARGYNAQDPRLPPHDDAGHGTHVAGIIAGALNWSGMAGVAPEATILPVKVLNSSGSGKVSEILEGLEWAVNNKADIINMSLGGTKGSDAQAKALKAARKAGVLVVCAAGNDGKAVNYPAAYEDAAAVSAMDYANKLTNFSSRGPEIDFIAPGSYIFSAFPGGAFRLMNGTSQAAPQVSGMAALAVSLGVKGEAALRAALTKASYNLGLPPQHQGAGAPVAAYLVGNIPAAK